MENKESIDPIFGRKDENGSNNPGSNAKANDKILLEFLGIRISRITIRPVKPELDPLDVVRRLLEDFEHEESISKSRSVVHLHRIIENTHARRRLERWSLRVIRDYLLIVLGIIICTYARIPFLKLPFLEIPDNIMVAILTTTTANIIGLGLIVLRGHFLAKKKDKPNKSTAEKDNSEA